ncbi:MAG: DNA polymerase/3'-5' exonuclease PolX [Sphingobacteriales bacterium]|nr:MAG: DNA polymerase/3'-5' exonuclease PolX [Sphingobacteriales bacterium]
MNNYEIADYFSLLAKLLDIHGENPFKIKSYSIAAFTLEKLERQIADMEDGELYSQRGIGEQIGKKIREIQETGKLQLLEKMIAATPPGVIDMLQVKGLGPKKIAVIWKDLGIESLGELEYACNENRLVTVKGFGAKTQVSILESLKFIRQSEGFHLWAEVMPLASELLAKLKSLFPSNRFEISGQLRRQEEIVEYIEVVTDLGAANLISQFEKVADTVIEELPNEITLIRMPGYPAIRFHRCHDKDFERILFLTTGNEAFLSAFLSRYAIPEAPESEKAIFQSQGLAYISPALRETAVIVDHAADGDLKELIQKADIKGIIHSHSTWSDGLDSIRTMATSAIKQGFEYLVISDHSQSAYYAGGLTPDKIAAQHQEIEKLNEELAPFRIFKSIEADILGDGSLDYSAAVLDTFDLVIASVHSNLKMTMEKAMTRILTAIKNPYTTILGHPTGRLLLTRAGYPIDHKLLIDACAEHQVVIEINAHPRRLDMDWRWIEYAMSKGVLLSIDPDAHSAAAFGDIYYGVMSAQKGGLTRESNLSSYSLAEFELFLKTYKVRTSAAAGY